MDAKKQELDDADIVAHLAAGYTVKQISEATGNNKRTLEKRIEIIKKISGSLTSAHLVANYFRKNLIE